MLESRVWMDEATDQFLGAVGRLTAVDWDEPTALTGWRPREIVAHVHHNAEALQRLASWARTGVEARMYASVEQRDGDIRRSAELPVDELRALVSTSAASLAEDLDRLTDEQWQQEIVTATNRTVRATEIPWMRSREAAIHAIDLGTGLTFNDLSSDFNDALVHDVVGLRLRRGEGATLAAWLTGRGVSGTELGRWI